MIRRLLSRQRPRPDFHAGRPRRSAAEFAAAFFAGSRVETDAALHVFGVLEKATEHDLSGLEPDDRLADLIPKPDVLDRVEAMMDIELKNDPARLRVTEEVLLRPYWNSLLRQLLGSARSRCTWDPLTLPVRSVRGLVAEIVRRSAPEQG